MQFIVATHNTHKTREIEQILEPGLAVRDLTAYPEISQIAESGTTFEENAKVKAAGQPRRLFCRHSKATRLPGSRCRR